MQAYAYYEMEINDVEAVETGTVVSLPTPEASNLLEEPIATGTLPIVLILEWRDTGNHFQVILMTQDVISATANRWNLGTHAQRHTAKARGLSFGRRLL